MTSTSPDDIVLRDLPDDTVGAAGLGQELRSGRWTRLGHNAVLGDTVAEASLQGLAERTRSAAQAQGYAIGWAAGCRVALEQTAAARDAEDQRMETERTQRATDQELAMSALLAATKRLEGAFTDAGSHATSHAVELALQIASAVLGREIATADDPGSDALRRALDLVPAGAPVVVRLHPTDLAALDPTTFDLHAVRLVEDATLARGDAVAESDDLVIDATVAAALDRVRKVLAP